MRCFFIYLICSAPLYGVQQLKGNKVAFLNAMDQSTIMAVTSLILITTTFMNFMRNAHRWKEQNQYLKDQALSYEVSFRQLDHQLSRPTEKLHQLGENEKRLFREKYHQAYNQIRGLEGQSLLLNLEEQQLLESYYQEPTEEVQATFLKRRLSLITMKVTILKKVFFYLNSK